MAAPKAVPGVDTGKVINTVLIIGGVIALVFLLAFFWNKLKDLWADFDSTINRVGKDQDKLSFSDAQYEAWSGEIRNAFNGMGSNEATLYAIFGKLKTDADIKKLVEVFGIRKWGSTWFDNYEYSLVEGIHAELDDEELAKVNSIISGNGINYSF